MRGPRETQMNTASPSRLPTHTPTHSPTSTTTTRTVAFLTQLVYVVLHMTKTPPGQSNHSSWWPRSGLGSSGKLLAPYKPAQVYGHQEKPTHNIESVVTLYNMLFVSHLVDYNLIICQYLSGTFASPGHTRDAPPYHLVGLCCVAPDPV